MKLMRYSGRHEAAMLARLGILVGDGLVADLRAGYARYLVERARNPRGQQVADIYFPPYIVQFLHAGEAAWLALADAHGYLTELAQNAPDATGLSDQELFMPLADCQLYAPLRPSKLICVSGGMEEGARQLPETHVKTLSAIIGPDRQIMKPPSCNALACETKLAIVIGKKCKRVTESEAYGVIAGYTVVNDVAASDDDHAASRHLLLGKTYDTFSPMGPWIVTRGGVPDAMSLRMGLRVNGKPRQEGDTGQMALSVPKLVAQLSQITLMPGDVIAVGPTSHGSRPHAAATVIPGDIVEAEIEGIGVLRNSVIEEPDDDSLNFSD